MTEQESSETVPSKVECPAAKDPAVRLFIGMGMALAFGLWCIYEVFIVRKYTWEPAGDINAKATYLFNLVCAILLPIVALVLLLLALRFMKRVLVADDEGIGYVGGEKLAWSDVKGLDTEKFADKGILRLIHEGPGGEQRLTLDGWKLQNFKALVALVESKVKPGD